MSIFYFLKSKTNGRVIDIVQASKAKGALLDAWPQKSQGNDNQLWQIIPDSAGSGYSLIQSKLNGNVIDIVQGALAPGTLLDAWPPNNGTAGSDNQLWMLVPDPAGSGYYSIQSKLNGNVIDILGGEIQDGTLLDAYTPQGSDNQLWMMVLTYYQALFEFWTTDDDLRQDSALYATFFGPVQAVIDPPPATPQSNQLTVKAFDDPKLDNWSYNSLRVALDPTLDPSQLASCQLTLGQGGTGIFESSDEWHIGAIRITLQNPGTNEQVLIYGDAARTMQPLESQYPYQASTVQNLNQANPSISLGLTIPRP